VRKPRSIPRIAEGDQTLQLLRQSTMDKQKLIEQATRKVVEAENQATDLSINIEWVVQDNALSMMSMSV
jgi:hypothetical protein